MITEFLMKMSKIEKLQEYWILILNKILEIERIYFFKINEKSLF